jgi:hypothetical protein
MNDVKPDHTILTARFPVDAFRELKAYAKRTGVSQSDIIVNGAIRELQRRKRAAHLGDTSEAALAN